MPQLPMPSKSLLLLQLVLLLHHFGSYEASDQGMPRFRRHQDSVDMANRVILSSATDVWHVDDSSAVAFMSKGAKLHVKVGLEGGRWNAWFVCRLGSTSEVNELVVPSGRWPSDGELNSSSPDGSEAARIHLRWSSREELELELLDFMVSSYLRALDTWLAVWLRVVSPAANFTSGKLYIKSLDSINSINAQPVHAWGKNYKRRLLTTEAVKFLISPNASAELSGGDGLGSLQFIDPDVIKTIKQAPDIIRPYINLGAFVSMHSQCLPKVHLDAEPTAYIVAGLARPDSLSAGLQKTWYLSLVDGKLHFAKRGFLQALRNMFGGNGNLFICVTVAVSSGGLQGSLADVIENFPVIDYGGSSVNQAFGRIGDCHLVASDDQLSVKMFTGAKFTPLLCPIVCSSKDELYWFRSPSGASLISKSDNTWTSLEDGHIRINPTGSAIQLLPGADPSRHSGAYTCSAGRKSFTYNVSVVSLPQFRLQDQLPAVIYAVEGEKFDYWCSAHYSGLTATPSMDAKYWLRPSSTGASWRSVNSSYFDPKTLTQEVVPASANAINVSVRVLRVPSDVPFPHRFVCRASISQADADIIPEYSASISSSLYYIARPTLDSFIISYPKSCCSLESGVEFSVSLTPELSDHLKSIGVRVTGFFKFDDRIYLRDVTVLNQVGVAETNFDNGTNRIFFKIAPIADTKSTPGAGVQAELNNWLSLVPAFNFHYPLNVAVDKVALRLYKPPPPNGGVPRDCSTDKSCFYSTEFDSNLTDRLRYRLPVPAGLAALSTAAFGAGTIAGIVLGLVFLLLLLVLLLAVFGRLLQPGRVYHLEAKERSLGRDTLSEARSEQFKEYQRMLNGANSPATLLMSSPGYDDDASSIADTEADVELDAYEDETTGDKFGEDGSVILQFNGSAAAPACQP